MGIFFRDDDDKDDDEYTGPNGDPLHDAIYGWDMGFSSDYDLDEDKKTNYGNDGDTLRFAKRDNYSKKAWDYYMDFKEEEALHYIDLALDLDKSHSNNWNIKAIILEAMKRYRESEECYDRSLKLSFDNLFRGTCADAGSRASVVNRAKKVKRIAHIVAHDLVSCCKYRAEFANVNSF